MSEREDAILTAMLERREAILTAKVLGDAGQRWTRHHFVKSKHFEQITRAKNLGLLVDRDGKNAIDLFVTDIVGRRYAVSIKNARDVVGTRKTMDWVREIRDFARAHDDHQDASSEADNLRPWLIPSFASPEAIAACAEEGVICTPMGSRIAPERYSGRKSMRLALRELRAVIGPEPFSFVGQQRVHEIDSGFLQRIDAVATRAAEPAEGRQRTPKRRKPPARRSPNL